MIQKNDLCLDQINWVPCPVDSGKGALILKTASGLTVANVHIPYNTQAAQLLLKNIPWPDTDNQFLCVGDMNRYSENFMKLIVQARTNKARSTFLVPITTNKPTRVGLNQDDTRKAVWIDYFVISTSLKQLALSPAIVYDDIGNISDHYPILLGFKYAQRA